MRGRIFGQGDRKTARITGKMRVNRKGKAQEKVNKKDTQVTGGDSLSEGGEKQEEKRMAL